MKKLMRKIWWNIEEYVTDPLCWMMALLIVMAVGLLVFLVGILYGLCTGQVILSDSTNTNTVNWSMYWTLYNMRQILG